MALEETFKFIVELPNHFYTVPAKLAQTLVALLALGYVYFAPNGNLQYYALIYIGFTLITAIISLYAESNKSDGFPLCLKCRKPLLQLIGAKYSCSGCGTEQRFGNKK